MRIWDIPPKNLCRQHLLGEHRELHALWTILLEGREGYKNHPETKRWVGKIGALRKRHEALVDEMRIRGYKHNSPLQKTGTTKDSEEQDALVHTLGEQLEILRRKGCSCILEKN